MNCRYNRCQQLALARGQEDLVGRGALEPVLVIAIIQSTSARKLLCGSTAVDEQLPSFHNHFPVGKNGFCAETTQDKINIVYVVLHAGDTIRARRVKYFIGIDLDQIYPVECAAYIHTICCKVVSIDFIGCHFGTVHVMVALGSSHWPGDA